MLVNSMHLGVPGIGPPWTTLLVCYAFTFLLRCYFFKGSSFVMRLAFPAVMRASSKEREQ